MKKYAFIILLMGFVYGSMRADDSRDGLESIRPIIDPHTFTTEAGRHMAHVVASLGVAAVPITVLYLIYHTPGDVCDKLAAGAGMTILVGFLSGWIKSGIQASAQAAGHLTDLVAD